MNINESFDMYIAVVCTYTLHTHNHSDEVNCHAPRDVRDTKETKICFL